MTLLFLNKFNYIDQQAIKKM